MPALLSFWRHSPPKVFGVIFDIFPASSPIASTVLLQGKLSDPRSHALGTPQGSILSPFLFNILMEGIFTVFMGSASCVIRSLSLAAAAMIRPHGTYPPTAMVGESRFEDQPPKMQVYGLRAPTIPGPLLLGDTAIEFTDTHQYLGI